MKHILIVDVSSSVGGIETLFYGLFGKKQKYFKVSFLAYNKKCAFEDEYIALGYDVYHLKSRRENPFGFAKQIKQFFIEHNEFDYVWVNTASTSMYQCQYYAKRFTKATIITHSHGTEFEKTSSHISYLINQALSKINYLKVVNNTDLFFCCSIKAGVALFGDKYFDKLVLVRNGIDLDKFLYSEENRKNIRESLGISADDTVIGLIGRISNQKNPIKAISIFSSYLNINQNSKLIIIGDGNLRDELEKRIEEEKIVDKVIMLGYRRDIPELLSAIDILLMPSLFEGLPLTAVEAQANGIHCLLSDTITKEVAITDLVEFLGLTESDEEWARCMSNFENSKNRAVYNSVVRKEKYDINDTIQYLHTLLK